MRLLSTWAKIRNISAISLLICFLFNTSVAFPSPADDYKYLDRDYASPGAHQLASWIASQLRPKEYVPVQDIPPIPYRLPLQGKRNSEVTNAIIGSEETQKMYRNGK